MCIHVVFMVRFLCVSVCFVSSGANLPVQLDCLSPRMSVGTVSRILPQLQSGVTKMAITSRLCCQPFLCQHLWNHTRSHCIIPSVHVLSVRRESSQNLHTCTSLQITPVKSQRMMMCSQKLLHSVLNDKGCVLSRSLIPLNRNLSQSQLLCNKYEPPNTMQSNVHNFGSALKHARNFSNNHSVHGRDNFGRIWYQFSGHNRCMIGCYDFKRFGYHSSTWKCFGRRLYGTAATKETGDPLSPDSAPFKCYIEHLRKEHQTISDTLQVCFQPPNLLVYWQTAQQTIILVNTHQSWVYLHSINVHTVHSSSIGRSIGWGGGGGGGMGYASMRHSPPAPLNASLSVFSLLQVVWFTIHSQAI